MRLLLDGDKASYNGNWQWMASVGVDPQPPFRRMFSPERQRERVDPDGAYVRRYVPELRNGAGGYAEPMITKPRRTRRSSATGLRGLPATSR
jgi:deoxyribodipyrimidine photolyase